MRSHRFLLAARSLQRARILALTGVVIGALVVAACQPASLSGGGHAASVIEPKKQLHFDIHTNADCGGTSSSTSTTVGPGGSPAGSPRVCMGDGLVTTVKGEFRDDGRNPAFPWGVSMNFSGAIEDTKLGLAFGFGTEDCSFTLSAQHDRSTAPACYFGFVTYRSTDTKHYPNTMPFTENTQCLDSLSGFPFATQQRIRSLGAGSGKDQLSGLALVVLGDSGERRGRGAQPDVLFLGVLCGPYAHLPFAPLTTPSKIVPKALYEYSYGTCPVGTSGSPYGGMIPILTDTAAPASPIYELGGCVVALRNGNLRIELEGTPDSSTSTTAL